MDITISIFTLSAIIIIALLAGFWVGRSIRWMMLDTESRLDTQEEAEASGTALTGNGSWEDNRTSARKVRKEGKRLPIESVWQEGKRISLGWSIGSPVTGEVRTFCEGTRRGALLYPEQGKFYAPASGKITRLYPMGNAMLLRADCGVEIMMRVGEVKDELCSSCFRSYVVQNEVVHKGKLLLEFDREGLQKEGVIPNVSVTVETAGDYGDITVTQSERVKSGEELLWVRDVSGADDN